MKIIQISDMHITPESSLDSIKPQISKLYDALRHRLEKTETIVFYILKDIVDKGDPTVYAKALDALNYMKKLFSEFNPRFEFTPGNHDLCDCPYPHPTPAVCTIQRSQQKIPQITNRLCQKRKPYGIKQAIIFQSYIRKSIIRI